MKVLLVNKFLYRAGGCENYMIELGKALIDKGHEVEYFGTKSHKDIVGNKYDLYVKSYDDKKMFNPLSVVYSFEAKKIIKKMLNRFKPDIVHMNNISFHLTSSIIDACKECSIPVVMTIHDPQLVCPNHRLYRTDIKSICNECLEKNDFRPCLKNKCIKGSRIKSFLAFLETKFTHKYNKYSYISKYICPSEFIKDKLIKGFYPIDKMVLLRNYYINANYEKNSIKKDYILYFGRISEEKGLDILCHAIPNGINLVIAGAGPCENYIKTINKNNIKYVGFKSGKDLQKLISEAMFSIYPSKCYENCPLSIFESISLGTPVIASNCGGIPELIDDGINGLLFENKNVDDLQNKIIELYNNHEMREKMYENCTRYNKVPDINKYIDDLELIYKECIDNA